MKGLDGKVALVTGGGKGIGRAIALTLAAHGVRIVVTGREERALGEVVGEIAHGGGKARHLAGDARDAAHVDAAVARAALVFGKLDIIVANAAECAEVEISGDRGTAQSVFQTNVGATWMAFSAGARQIANGGRMIATAALRSGARGSALATAAGAIGGLVRSVAAELAPKLVACNALVPGEIDLRRETTPEELAEIVAFLCSDAAAGITGQRIQIR